MHHLRTVVCLILLLVILAGCQTDTKLASAIYQKTEKAVSYEADFSKNQETLNEMKEEEKNAYMDILDLDVTETKKLKEKAKNARKYVEKQQELITKAQDQFDESYSVLKTIKANKNGINDEEQKEKVEKMGELMTKRKDVIQTYFDDYQENLDLRDSFYVKFEEEEEIDADELDKQIDKMNKSEKNLAGLIDQFNQATDQYNEAKREYYDLVDLKEKDIKKAGV